MCGRVAGGKRHRALYQSTVFSGHLRSVIGIDITYDVIDIHSVVLHVCSALSFATQHYGTQGGVYVCAGVYMYVYKCVCRCMYKCVCCVCAGVCVCRCM